MPCTVRGCVGTATLLITLLCSGCGPQTFSAKGTVNSDGGPLRAWSRAPLSCQRGEYWGHPERLVIFEFDLPPGFEASHPGNRNAPEELAFAPSGNGVIGSLKVFSEVTQPGEPNTTTQTTDGFLLDTHNCRTIRLDRQEQSRDSSKQQIPLKGHLVLDCNVIGSHVTADVTFNHCTF